MLPRFAEVVPADSTLSPSGSDQYLNECFSLAIHMIPDLAEADKD